MSLAALLLVRGYYNLVLSSTQVHLFDRLQNIILVEKVTVDCIDQVLGEVLVALLIRLLLTNYADIAVKRQLYSVDMVEVLGEAFQWLDVRRRYTEDGEPFPLPTSS